MRKSNSDNLMRKSNRAIPQNLFTRDIELAVSVVWPRCLFVFAGGHSNTQVGPDTLNWS